MGRDIAVRRGQGADARLKGAREWAPLGLAESAPRPETTANMFLIR